MKKLLKNKRPVIVVAIMVFILVVSFGKFSDWNLLKALLYPPSEVNYNAEGDYGNTLKVLSFTDGIKTNLEIKDAHNGDMGGTTPYSRSYYDKEIRDVLLEAPLESKNSDAVFVGWSGCDATRKESGACQVSVTDYQTRKVEAHYMEIKERPLLQIFNISNNKVEGNLTDKWPQIKPEFAYKAAHTGLTGIDLDGSLPDKFGEFESDIKQINLGGNNLKGKIPSSIGSLNDLEYLGLYDNNLTGSIPEEIGNLTNLKYLLLHNNQLSGKVPESLNNLKNLNPNELRLDNNNLTGIEDGLIEGSNWAGINFYNNSLNASAIDHILEEAADREDSGNYINLCGNNVSAEIKYNLDGTCDNVNFRDSINAAVKEGWTVYFPVDLEQEYQKYSGCRIDSRRCDCVISSASGSRTPPMENISCARITNPINNCDDLKENKGIPSQIQRAAEYSGCNWYRHDPCKPTCKWDEDGEVKRIASNCIYEDTEKNAECRKVGTEDGERSDKKNEDAESVTDHCN